MQLVAPDPTPLIRAVDLSAQSPNKGWSIRGCCAQLKNITSCIWRPSCPFESQKIRSSLSATKDYCQGIASTVASAVLDFFDQPVVLSVLTTTSIAGIALSASSLTPVLVDYCNACTPELSGFSGDLAACREPYGWQMTLYESLIGASCGLIGYIAQKVLEKDNALAQKNTRSCFDRAMDQVKGVTEYIQNNHSYEISLGIGYLYNEGFWLDPNNPNAWIFYFQCQAASIGIASALLGMYARTQWVVLKNHFLGSETDAAPLSHFSLKNRCKVFMFVATTGSLVILTFIPSLPLEARTVLKEISLMLLAKPIGRICASQVQYQKEHATNQWKKKTFSTFGGLLRISPSVFVTLGYYSYLSAPAQSGRLFGLALVGFATGLKDIYYQPPQRGEIVPKPLAALETKKGKVQCASRTWNFTKEYWKTGALITFAITSSKWGYLDCYSLAEYICPFTLQISDNYVSIDGNGINMIIEVGLVHYYVRKIFKYLAVKSDRPIVKLMGQYVHFTNKYQFDLLSLIPYAIFKSGIYNANYNTYATYNPQAFLVLLGITFGTYKENVDAQTKDAYRPMFTNASIVSSTIIPIL